MTAYWNLRVGFGRDDAGRTGQLAASATAASGTGVEEVSWEKVVRRRAMLWMKLLEEYMIVLVDFLSRGAC